MLQDGKLKADASDSSSDSKSYKSSSVGKKEESRKRDVDKKSDKVYKI